MKITTTTILTSVLGLLLFTSCSHRLVGTWDIQRYENTVSGAEATTLNNIGTMQFKKNGTGEKKVNYTLLGASKNDDSPFKWNWNNDEYVTIEGADSEFSKTWIIITNKRKHQLWRSTDGTQGVQTLELKR